jgi:KDO2-lipid IV(A) lauroyltransferase
MNRFFSALLWHMLIKPVSKLPFSLLFALSDILYLVLYRAVRYRRKLVFEQLKSAFPGKNNSERKEIERAFYRQFSDNMLMTVKGLSASSTEIAEHMKCENPELLNKILDEGKSVIIMVGHFYSWEWWILAINKHVEHQIVLFYKTLSNAYFEQKLKKIRRGFGVEPVALEETKDFIRTRDNAKKGYIFGSDQAPHQAHKARWVHFLNQETPFALGADVLAREKNMAVVFCELMRQKRGYYSYRFQTITPDASTEEFGQITHRYVQMLEKRIKADPPCWLWSHNRWKREKPEGMVVHPL